MLSDEMKIIEKNDVSLFNDSYIERSSKETEELIAEESVQFFDQPISFLKKHKEQFIYIETSRFNIIGIDSLCLEVDDVFGTYEAMLGLRLQKKHEKTIKDFLEIELMDKNKSSLLFSQADGLWDFNFAINGIDGFQEEMTISEACRLVYLFLFKLIMTIEEKKQ
ncbi:branched-chain amino acid aminotransferase [Bacillus sp. S/N-304-OC-R1]|nr:branched-chain amino acid aminotransferase [Bacillus sp. S/N-304-OC-R1]